MDIVTRYPIASVAFVCNRRSEKVEGLKRAMRQWFEGRGVPCAFFAYDCSAEELLNGAARADIVIVLGGDGSIVSVARKLAAAPKPIIGVNFGRVGFLAEISPDFWESAFSRMLEQGVAIDKSLSLSYALIRGGETVLTGLAVNDLVVSRGGPARLVSLALTVDDMRLAVLRADGLIVASPTGSTGYTGSARGPLLYPGLNAYAVTAICPFMSNFSPLVLDCETRFSITVDEAGSEIYLTVDGQESLEVSTGDTLKVCGKRDGILFARIDTEGYFAKLRSTGFVRDFSQ